MVRRALRCREYGCAGFAAFDDATFIRFDSAQCNQRGKANGRVAQSLQGFRVVSAVIEYLAQQVEGFIKKLKDAGVLVRRDQQGNGSDTVREAPEP